MTYIAFVGYSEADFKDFKIGNHSVSICRKEDYPDPSDYILRHAQKLGTDGEKCVENIIMKVIKNPIFKSFELLPTHHIPHSGDYLFMSKQVGICFMLECKNKQNISHSEDLQKFLTDIENVHKLYNLKTIGVFLQLGSNKITSHDSIELNDNTVYLSKDYVNKSCLEIIFTHYSKLVKRETFKFEDIPFIQKCIHDLESIRENNKKELETLAKVVSRSEHIIRSLSRTMTNLNTQNELLDKIIDAYNNYSIQIEDIDSLDSLDSMDRKPTQEEPEEVDDVFDFIRNDDAQSCIVGKKPDNADKNKLFAELSKLNMSPSSLTKKELTKKFPQHVIYINRTKLDDIRKEYRMYTKSKH